MASTWTRGLASALAALISGLAGGLAGGLARRLDHPLRLGLTLCLLASLPLLNGCDKSPSRGEYAAPSGLEGAFTDGRVIRSDGHLVLVIFGSSGCHFCKKLLEDIRRDKALYDYIAKQTKSYYINANASTPYEVALRDHKQSLEASMLAGIYEVRATPTLVFISKDGATLLRYPGYIGPKRLLATLRFLNNKALWGQSEQEIARALMELYRREDV